MKGNCHNHIEVMDESISNLYRYEAAELLNDGSIGLRECTIAQNEWFDIAFGGVCVGAKIKTPNGNVPIEDLRPGDVIYTAQMKTALVKWIGTSTNLSKVMPVVSSKLYFMEDGFEQGMPSDHLCLDPFVHLLHEPAASAYRFEKSPKACAARQFILDEKVIEVDAYLPKRMLNICLENENSFIANNIGIQTADPVQIFQQITDPQLSAQFASLFNSMNLKPLQTRSVETYNHELRKENNIFVS